MAQARMIHRAEANDTTLNSLPLAHILAFHRLIVRCDDWGRFAGEATVWRNELFVRQPLITDQIIYAIQFDLAQAGLVGFYTVGTQLCSLVFRFMRYQTVKTSHMKPPEWPTPPRDMWPLWLHPMDTRKGFDCPDMPYAEWRVLADKGTQRHEWLPPGVRPSLQFTVDEQHPFGHIMVAAKPKAKPPERKEAEAKPTQQELLPSPLAASMTELEKRLWDVLSKIKGFSARSGRDKTISYFREHLFVDFPDVDWLDLVKSYAAGKVTRPLLEKSLPMAELRNWAKVAQERAQKRRDMPATPTERPTRMVEL